MVANATSEADAATSGARGTTGNYSHGGDTENTRNLDAADIGIDEAHSGAVHDQTRAWNANVKRTFDEFQGASLEAAKRSRDHYDAMVTDARNHTNAINKLVIETLSNAGAVAHGEAQRSVRHGDVASDRMWNVDEVAQLVAKNGVFSDAIAGAVAAALAAGLKESK